MINTFRFHYDATIVVSVKGDFKNEQEANEKAREIAENFYSEDKILNQYKKHL